MHQGYAVIDVETTGFSATKDRMVELAVVLVEPDGTVEQNWSTLLNPGRDVGPTHVHGITARDVLTAPSFSRIAPLLLESLDGRIIVAHNAQFDVAFLRQELLRLDFIGLDVSDLPSVCTYQTARRDLRHLPDQKLRTCCEALDIDLVHAHSARGDALATAELFVWQLGHHPEWSRKEGFVRSSESRGHLSSGNDTHAVLLDRELAAGLTAARRRPGGWLEALAPADPASFTAIGLDPQGSEYLRLLDQALLDQYLSEHEIETLLEELARLDATRSHADHLHREYLTLLSSRAWADGIVTDQERTELSLIASLLGLSEADVDEALTEATTTSDSPVSPAGGTLDLAPGDRVVVTGPQLKGHSEWLEILDRAGLTSGGITKKTKALVAGDPDSLSGKAMKARNYGIPVLGESAFLRILSELPPYGASE